MESKADARTELASIAASLRAYLEWQRDTGAAGIPRMKRGGAASSSKTPAGSREPSVPQNAPAVPRASQEAPRVDGAAAPSGATPRTQAPRAEPTRAQPDFSPDGNDAASAARAPAIQVAPSLSLAARAARLPVLGQEVASCVRCDLAATRTNTVFARGNPAAALCFVGEAPGADEDAQGLPFVGRAGQLLDKMIAAMGLAPERDVYVCNIIKCRPPDNRKPSPEETETCIPYLHEQLALVDPKVIVALGNTAVAALLGTKLGITKVRGSWKLYKGKTLVMPTYHPSYLLRPSAQQVEAKKLAWDDLQAVMKELGLAPPPKGASKS